MNAVIEAAFIAVAERGAAAPTRYVAALAGISVGPMVENFPGKEALFEAVGDRFEEETRAIIQSLMP